MMESLFTEATAIAFAPFWAATIWGVVELVKRTGKVPRPMLPILPLIIGVITGPAAVEFMVMCVESVDSFPAVHSLAVGLGAGAFASSIHDTKSAREKDV